MDKGDRNGNQRNRNGNRSDRNSGGGDNSVVISGDTVNRIHWITRTGSFLTLLIAWQTVTVSFGNSLITGSGVNFLLIVSTMTVGGLSTGLSVAAISPIIAKVFGIGPLWSIIPCIMAGNAVLVLLWYTIGECLPERERAARLIALFCAAAAKFLVLYIGAVRIVLPIFISLPAPQMAVIANMFSLPQLFTALAGGSGAFFLLPALKKIIK